MRKSDVAGRFWYKVKLIGASDSDCWEWNGKTNKDGYGKVYINGKEYMAHRVSYELSGKSIPEGLQLDHLCRNRRCVNPSHLEPVTLIENVLRGNSPYAKKKRQSHCKRGHPLSGKNLKIRSNGTRYCIECEQERVRSGYYRERYKRHASRNVVVG